jgi:pimeloyl-ACP methyl ester carboxylesterase
MHQKLARTTLVLAILCTVSLNSQALYGRENFTEAGDFSEAAILNGVRATQSQCTQTANAVWAAPSTTDAECLRYWAAGFDAAPVKRAVVFFHGDIFVGIGKTSSGYLGTSQAAQQAAAQNWAKKLGVPYIAIGRPGTHGSSGDHMQRRRRPESEIISAALDQLKTRLGVEEWVVAGQSGGGHVTASLLTLRNDIVCAVPTSSPSSPRTRWELIGRTRDTTNYADSYEPWEHLAKDRMHPAVRVLVLGDPKDKNVFWASQTVLADALKKINVPVAVLSGEGLGPDSHGLSNSARLVAGWCAKDTPTTEIESLAAKGLKG